MAGETYYFMFSLISVMSVLLWLVNLLLLRVKGKTTFGLAYKPGTPEYKRGIKFANNRNLAITVILTLILITNLVYDVNRLLVLEDYPHGLLLYLTGFFLIMFIVLLPAARKQARAISQLGITKNKHE